MLILWLFYEGRELFPKLGHVLWIDSMDLLEPREKRTREISGWPSFSFRLFLGALKSKVFTTPCIFNVFLQVMPIITPTFPHQNSTFNVTTNTLKLIKEKMCVASEICLNIKLGSETWEALFQVSDVMNTIQGDWKWDNHSWAKLS